MARVLALVASAPTSGGHVHTHFSFAERTSADRHLARKLEGFKTHAHLVRVRGGKKQSQEPKARASDCAIKLLVTGELEGYSSASLVVR